MSSIRARLNTIWPRGKNSLIWSTCCSFEKKKKLQACNQFSRLYLNFQDFFQVWKIAGQISRIQDSVRTLKRTKMQRELTSAGGIRYNGNKFCSIHKTVPLWYNAIENTTFNVQLYSNNSLKTVVLKRQSLSFKQLLNADLVVIAKAKNTGEQDARVREPGLLLVHKMIECPGKMCTMQ